MRLSFVMPRESGASSKPYRCFVSPGWRHRVLDRPFKPGDDEAAGSAHLYMEFSLMKLTFSPASPYARKVRIAAIELGLIDRITFVPTAVQPGKFNEDYSRTVNPLRKLPALILDDGSTIVD